MNQKFEYSRTFVNVRCYYKNNKWGKIELSTSEYINIHLAATCLNYGQEAFEGFKVVKGRDNKIRIFRWEDNLKRLNISARGIQMPQIPTELFFKGLILLLTHNKNYIPAYNSGRSLYVRPLLLGIGGNIGLYPSKKYLLVMFCFPVETCSNRNNRPVNLLLTANNDRKSTNIDGQLKTGANYSHRIRQIFHAKKNHYYDVLYLDPIRRKYIEECSRSGVFAIKENKFIVPDSDSIIKSITSDSIIQLAGRLGLKIEKRKISIDELEQFEEFGICGTVTSIIPVGSIFDNESRKLIQYLSKKESILDKLYAMYLKIQAGEETDHFKWITCID